VSASDIAVIRFPRVGLHRGIGKVLEKYRYNWQVTPSHRYLEQLHLTRNVITCHKLYVVTFLKRPTKDQ